jgi:hypothetical protein
MRIVRFACLMALLLSGLATAASARPFLSSAKGVYQFALEDKRAKYLEFDAQTQPDGSAAGRVFFSDEAPITFQDVDGTGDKTETFNGFYINAEVDGLLVSNNRAVVSATVRDSTIIDLVGKRVLLTVEDNGDNTRIPDRLTWGVYQPVQRNWTPSDAERKPDPGVGLRWWATDAERREDTGYEMPRAETFTIQSFPVSSYDFVVVANGSGDILVQP